MKARLKMGNPLREAVFALDARIAELARKADELALLHRNMPAIVDEAVVETLVFFEETKRCPCTCHEGRGILDCNCCRYPYYRPKTPSLQVLFDMLRRRFYEHAI